MTDLVRSILSSAAVNVLLTAGLVYLARTWIGERLKKSIEHEYLVALERLRADNAQYQSVQATAMTPSRQAVTLQLNGGLIPSRNFGLRF